LAGDGCGGDGPAQAIFSGKESAAARVGLAMRTFLFLIEASFAHRRYPGRPGDDTRLQSRSERFPSPFVPGKR
jgi:hypothetical protein